MEASVRANHAEKDIILRRYKDLHTVEKRLYFCIFHLLSWCLHPPGENLEVEGLSIPGFLTRLARVDDRDIHGHLGEGLESISLEWIQLLQFLQIRVFQGDIAERRRIVRCHLLNCSINMKLYDFTLSLYLTIII